LEILGAPDANEGGESFERPPQGFDQRWIHQHASVLKSAVERLKREPGCVTSS